MLADSVAWSGVVGIHKKWPLYEKLSINLCIIYSKKNTLNIDGKRDRERVGGARLDRCRKYRSLDGRGQQPGVTNGQRSTRTTKPLNPVLEKVPPPPPPSITTPSRFLFFTFSVFIFFNSNIPARHCFSSAIWHNQFSMLNNNSHWQKYGNHEQHQDQTTIETI
jgi:hypothetical protein